MLLPRTSNNCKIAAVLIVCLIMEHIYHSCLSKESCINPQHYISDCIDPQHYISASIDPQHYISAYRPSALYFSILFNEGNSK